MLIGRTARNDSPFVCDKTYHAARDCGIRLQANGQTTVQDGDVPSVVCMVDQAYSQSTLIAVSSALIRITIKVWRLRGKGTATLIIAVAASSSAGPERNPGFWTRLSVVAQHAQHLAPFFRVLKLVCEQDDCGTRRAVTIVKYHCSSITTFRNTIEGRPCRLSC